MCRRRGYTVSGETFAIVAKDRLLTMITSGRPIPRQVAALSLGHLRIAGCTIPPPTIVKALLGQLDETAKVSIHVPFSTEEAYGGRPMSRLADTQLGR